MAAALDSRPAVGNSPEALVTSQAAALASCLVTTWAFQVTVASFPVVVEASHSQVAGSGPFRQQS